MLRPALRLCCLAFALAGCAAARKVEHGGGERGGTWIAIDTHRHATVGLDAMAAELARCDVVFLGEEHDQDLGHALQLELTRRILALRPNASLSFEMIERDAQAKLERFLDGSDDEKTFLADSRPWPNWRAHYRPLVLLAKERSLPVIAANVPRPLAARVSHGGLAAVRGEDFLPRTVLAPPGEYRRRFALAMNQPADSTDPGLDLWFLAQCLKDEAMAESIERALCAAPPGRIVLHYCGHFHSDYRLGTVERLLRRQPALRIGIVTMRTEEREPGKVDAELARSADYVLLLSK